jgi:hypothetical protein
MSRVLTHREISSRRPDSLAEGPGFEPRLTESESLPHEGQRQCVLDLKRIIGKHFASTSGNSIDHWPVRKWSSCAPTRSRRAGRWTFSMWHVPTNIPLRGESALGNSWHARQAGNQEAERCARHPLEIIPRSQVVDAAGTVALACSSETTGIASLYRPSGVIDLIGANCASTSPRRKVRYHCFGSPVVAFSASSISSATYACSRAIPRISARTGAAYSLRLTVRLKPYSRRCITGPDQGHCAYSLRLRRTHDDQERPLKCALRRAKSSSHHLAREGQGNCQASHAC